LLDSYHAKEEKFRSFLKSKDNPVSVEHTQCVDT
jgi:hypothetical protein